MDKEIRTSIDCACVIHDTLYSWDYVEKLHRSLQRNLSIPVRLHVYTEEQRNVPGTMIKHVLEEWPDIRGPKRSWWYKIQLFNTDLYSGDMLYFDLDTVITGNLDWIWNLPIDRYFWALKDFQYLYKDVTKINSSVMWFNNTMWRNVYQNLDIEKLKTVSKHYGDQDYIYENIPHTRVRFLDTARINSWRWQAHDGGWNFQNRRPKTPGTGTKISDNVSILVFHGNPKPHEIRDILVHKYWC